MNILQSGDKFVLADITNTYDKLPPGNYMLKFDRSTFSYYLLKKPPFSLPKKIYGDVSIVDRWLKSWKHNSDKNMGILLSGIKGSGKTVTAQKMCIDSKLPVIMISEPFEGSEFVDFLTSPILGECIIFIDEYEKVFDYDNSSDMLSLMDGMYNTKLLFLLTVNKDYIADYMVNRLNRIKYKKVYADLDTETINGVIEDLLINKDHRNSIFKFFERVNLRTFDLLTSIIKEMNLFNEDAIECGKHLNLKSEPKEYNVFEVVNGVEYKCRPTEFSFGWEGVSILRENVDYLKPFIDSSWKTQKTGFGFAVTGSSSKNREHFTEETPALLTPDTSERYYSDIRLNLVLEECICVVIDEETINIKHPNSKLEFNLVERKRNNLVF